MDPPILPPEKRTSFPSGVMVYVIAGIIALAIAMFLIFRPS
jgi:hypothetical protein